jgi:predicted membrane-bound spermidine synthase
VAWDHDEIRSAVDQRLDDLHRLWHQSADAYFDPDAFRVAIQSAIQTLRSVTFIVRTNKAIIPDFDRWPQVKTGKNFRPSTHPCTDPIVSPRTR